MGVLAIWHGYLLGATGSNIYTVNLVREWVRAGYAVVLLCQEPHPEQHSGLLHEYVRIRGGAVAERRELAAGGVAARREQGMGSCIMVQADVEGLLPVYVLDRYEGVEAARFVDLDDAACARYDAQIAGAMQWVVDTYPELEGVVINHAVPGPAALRPVLDAAGIPYAVKVHGSELEYAIAQDERFVAPAREGLLGAASVLVGSGHIDVRTGELLGRDVLDGRSVVVPPGVDLEWFVPLAGGSAAAATTQDRRALQEQLVAVLSKRESAQPGGRGAEQQAVLAAAIAGDAEQVTAQVEALTGTYQERYVDAGAAARFAALDVDSMRFVTYVGKFIEQKGVHLLLAAWPMVRAQCAHMHLLLPGFGPMRDQLEAMAVAAGTGQREAWHALVAPFPEIVEWHEQLEATGLTEMWWESACEMHHDMTWLGLVDHGVLVKMWPLCEVSVVPSVLAEAFGMVAAEAAACGALPMVADHSGLADVADEIAERYLSVMGISHARGCVAFDPTRERVVQSLTDALVELLKRPIAQRRALAQAARVTVEQEWGWSTIAMRVIELMTDATDHVTVPAPE